MSMNSNQKAFPDPVSYYRELLPRRKRTGSALNDSTRPRAFDEITEKNAGYFLLKALIDELDVREVIDILSSVQQYQFSVYDMMMRLIYSRAIQPCSKSKTVSGCISSSF